MIRTCLYVVWLALLSPAHAWAQVTTRVSVDSNGIQGNNYSGTYGDAISADGRYVAFGSGATNLVAGGSPLQWELFRHDLATGATVLLSIDANGVPGSSGSFYPSISADGACVAFESDSGFGTGDSNGRTDVFVHDFGTGATTLVSVNSNGVQWASDSCHNAAISGDGRYVAFHKIHPTTIYHHRTDVYVHDRQSGITSIVNVNTSGVQTTGLYSTDPAISFDGRWIAFASTAADLAGGDTNAAYDIFVRDMQAGSTVRASLSTQGTEGDGDSLDPSISSDGRFVAFSSVATNLVNNDVNGHADIFVHDLQTGATVLASVSSSGAQADADCLNPALSSDGRFVTFHSTATNLVPGDTNNQDDVFVRDLLFGTTELVSVALSGPSNGASDKPSISADGRLVAFHSYAGNLVMGDTNGTFDVFVRDRGNAYAFESFCSGDGTASACPCGNSGSPNHGCANSLFPQGAELQGGGTASVSADTFVLTGTGMPNASVLYFQGTAQANGGLGAVFGDGLRCAGGAVTRLATKTNAANSSTYPASGDVPISIKGAIPVSGGVRTYQAWYRNSSGTCGSGFNLTNGVQVFWMP